MATSKAIEVWNAIVASIAAIRAGGVYHLTPQHVAKVLDAVQNITRFPAVLVLPGSMESEFVTANGPYSTIRVRAEFSLLEIAQGSDAEETVLKLDSDIVNKITDATGGMLLGLDYVQDVEPGVSDPVVPVEGAAINTRWRERTIAVVYYHERGAA